MPSKSSPKTNNIINHIIIITNIILCPTYPSGSAAGLPCPVGTYGHKRGLTNETDCAPCDPGKYCDVVGLNSPAGDCTAGHYCLLGAEHAAPIGETWGYYCPEGHYCPTGKIFNYVPIMCYSTKRFAAIIRLKHFYLTHKLLS